MYFDTHTHVNLDELRNEEADVIKRALDQDVWMANVGTSFSSSKSAVEIAQKYDKGIYATIGQHPTEQEDFSDEAYERLLNNKVVAIGECGLDYHHLYSNDKALEIKNQKNQFVKQLQFAQKHGLPIVIHCREAYDDTLEILKSEYQGNGILHSFTDSWETAKKFLDLDFFIALNGILTYDKSGMLEEVCKNLPSDRIISETDAPYLTPVPLRGQRNEPVYVKHVVEYMAKVRNVPVEEMAEITFSNALSVYRIRQ